MKTFIVKYSPVIICATLLLNFVLATAALVKINSCNKVYTIGINRLTDSFTKNLNSSSLNSEQQSKQVINFGKGLEAALHDLKVQGKVLLMEEAVLFGGTDITSQVVNRIKHEADKHG